MGSSASPKGTHYELGLRAVARPRTALAVIGDEPGVMPFLAIAFGGAWAIWGTAWLLGAFDTGPFGQTLVALGAFSPAVGALVVRRWATREGFADAGLRLHLREGWPYYLFGWLLPLPAVALVYVVATALGIRASESGVSPTLVLAAVFGSVVGAPLFFGEEFGWRGYLQVRLFRGQALPSALATGLIWGVFHYPVILVGYEGYENVYLGLLVFPAFTIALSIILGWLRLKTGSVWATCLAHSAGNTIGGVLSSSLFLGSCYFLLASYAGVLGLLPLGLVALWLVLTGRLDQAARAHESG